MHGREERIEVERVKSAEEQEHAEHETKVTDAIDDKGFLAGIRRGFSEKVKADEQVAREADAFPADKEKHIVRGQHQDQHEKHEQVQIGKEAVVTAFVGHVSGGVDVN